MKTKSNLSSSAIRKVILLVSLAILASGATRIAYFLHEEFSIYTLQEFNASFEIGNGAALAIDSNELNFGKVPPNGNSRREILLYHEYEKPLKVKIVYTGNIKEILLPIEPFYLEPFKEEKIGLIAYALYNEPKKFTGTVKVLYIK